MEVVADSAFGGTLQYNGIRAEPADVEGCNLRVEAASFTAWGPLADVLVGLIELDTMVLTPGESEDEVMVAYRGDVEGDDFLMAVSGGEDQVSLFLDCIKLVSFPEGQGGGGGALLLVGV